MQTQILHWMMQLMVQQMGLNLNHHICRYCKGIWGMPGQTSSAVGIDQFCYGIIIIER